MKKLRDDNIGCYNKFIKLSGNIFQSTMWYEANGIKNYDVIIGYKEQNVCVVGLYVIKYDNNLADKILYFPRGPVFEEYDEEILKKFNKKAMLIAKENNCRYIRFDYYGESGSCDQYETLLRDDGFFLNENSTFWDFTWNIDISKLENLKYLDTVNQRTRYKINYAIRNGVKVVVDNSISSVEKFYKLIKITSIRDEFSIKKFEAYSRIFEQFKDDAKLYWAYKDNQLLSAAIFVKFGKVAYYLYGASSNEKRNLYPTYLLQYEMINEAINTKCDMYNMGGVGYRLNDSSRFFEGLLNFKSQFNGKMRENINGYIRKV